MRVPELREAWDSATARTVLRRRRSPEDAIRALRARAEKKAIEAARLLCEAAEIEARHE